MRIVIAALLVWIAPALAQDAERDRIREEELIAIGSATNPADRYIDRLEALDKEVTAGRLGERQHALHALEAARQIYPQDAELIALRAAKVPIAAAFEAGTITRDEYDARWAVARAAWQRNADARERAIREEYRREAAALPAGPSVADRFRELRGIRCTPGSLGTVTCR